MKIYKILSEISLRRLGEMKLLTFHMFGSCFYVSNAWRICSGRKILQRRSGRDKVLNMKKCYNFFLWKQNLKNGGFTHKFRGWTFVPEILAEVWSAAVRLRQKLVRVWSNKSRNVIFILVGGIWLGKVLSKGLIQKKNFFRIAGMFEMKPSRSILQGKNCN